MLTQKYYGGIQKNAVLLHKNDPKTKQKPKRFTNTYIDEFLLYG